MRARARGGGGRGQAVHAHVYTHNIITTKILCVRDVRFYHNIFTGSSAAAKGTKAECGGEGRELICGPAAAVTAAFCRSFYENK